MTSAQEWIESWLDIYWNLVSDVTTRSPRLQRYYAQIDELTRLMRETVRA